ncbi:hypothetical protein KJ765_02650 [Candidatus Micrarchaeota archaeon]|nr:hypothetical protein [Candidatus Micrarchaeota archaeon]
MVRESASLLLSRVFSRVGVQHHWVGKGLSIPFTPNNTERLISLAVHADAEILGLRPVTPEAVKVFTRSVRTNVELGKYGQEFPNVHRYLLRLVMNLGAHGREVNVMHAAVGKKNFIIIQERK